jgi:hypothetical protein
MRVDGLGRLGRLPALPLKTCRVLAGWVPPFACLGMAPCNPLEGLLGSYPMTDGQPFSRSLQPLGSLWGFEPVSDVHLDQRYLRFTTCF